MHKRGSGGAASKTSRSHSGDDITGVQPRSPRAEAVELPKLPSSRGERALEPPGEASAAAPDKKRRRKLGPARAQAKARTRESILDAACALFSEEGFDQPGLDTICSVAGRTRGAYNVHFRSREDLITTVALRAVEQVERRVCGAGAELNPVGGAAEHSPTQALLGFLLRRAEPEQLPPTLLLHAVSRYPAVRQGYLAALERMIQHVSDAAQDQFSMGKSRVDVTPRQTALMLTALLTGLDTLESLGLGASGGGKGSPAASSAPSREQLVELLCILLQRPSC